MPIHHDAIHHDAIHHDAIHHEHDPLDQELDRQRDTLLRLAVPELAGVEHDDFRAAVETLRPVVQRRAGGETSTSRVPFVLVVQAEMQTAEQLVPLLHLAGSKRPGVLDRNHGEEGLARYRPIPEVAQELPGGQVYVLFDVERGEEFCGVRPEAALPVISARDRTPLTIHEGIALVLLHPEVLEKNKCFMLSGSRRGDRRVPALWISARAPKLGWCWDGNPHTWLGVASAGARLGAQVDAS